MRKLNILARDQKTESLWRDELKTLQASAGGTLSNWESQISAFDRMGFSIVMVLEEKEMLPDPKRIDVVDDLLVFPFRLAEIMSVLKHHSVRHLEREALEEVELAHQSVQNANQLAERILKAKTPKRYTHIKGLNVMSRHLSGLKPGGDYFDVFESSKKDFVNILLVDSSTYGISAAFLGMILSSSARIANDASLSTADWVRAIYHELKLTLGDDGHFSVFFGRFNRSSFSLHYQLFGTIEAFIVEKEGQTSSLQKNGKSWNAKSTPEPGIEKIVALNPKDRIILLSDGFVNGVGGEFHLHKIIQERLGQDPFDLVNELSFQIKAKLNPGETFPGEDCSAIVIDIDQPGLRLAPTG